MKKVQYHELYCGNPLRYWIGLGVLASNTAVAMSTWNLSRSDASMIRVIMNRLLVMLVILTGFTGR